MVALYCACAEVEQHAEFAEGVVVVVVVDVAVEGHYVHLKNIFNLV